jgi:hypothetical protein
MLLIRVSIIWVRWEPCGIIIGKPLTPKNIIEAYGGIMWAENNSHGKELL